ncbi:PREDICTED: uncharacterized protein LOC107164511 [Diuraphis noxia]|uniref:uncharacterized protein LOC107164511 n=1 Tax=Diuraphis noxia TaxID=143948 RepID=UPI000763AC36|nr:PREDICTED: uncharacterized protein LOC107164511 [Diuraphis noxia]
MTYNLCAMAGRKKKDKAIQQAIMIAAMMAASVIGPMAIKIIILMAGKALLLSKIALLLSGMMMLKKLSQPQQINRHDTEFPASGHYYDPSIDAQHVAYSSQIQ